MLPASVSVASLSITQTKVWAARSLSAPHSQLFQCSAASLCQLPYWWLCSTNWPFSGSSSRPPFSGLTMASLGLVVANSR